ncbi:MAG: phytoene desaturase family protein [Cytophagaceae bacterium]|nr:phytoene desaturase family protein [Cytophagaceae bacterium]MDW8456082.1 phytoene desaturase family protein [Cytophagaceae bacterium]
MLKKAIVIGAGFSGLSAAACLAQKGFTVQLIEKNSYAGGRAHQRTIGGFNFDMGPSFYWMPEVFENFYNRFGHTASDFYTLKKLDPSYRVQFSNYEYIDMPSGIEQVIKLFESIEPGCAHKLTKFFKDAEYKYKIGMGEFVHKPSLSVFEFVDLRVLSSLFRMQLFTSISKEIRKTVTHPRLRQLLEFPVLFLGAKPADTPALYSLMNYADIALGTWYPMGGMVKVVEAMKKICDEQGVQFLFNSPVEKIVIKDNIATGVIAGGEEHYAHVVVSSADYHHTEQALLSPEYRTYNSSYWNKRKMAPSCLMYYLGISKKLVNLLHHTLFFDEDFDRHASEIYDHPVWPSAPLFYTSCTSITDEMSAPRGCENLVILIPVAAGLKDDSRIREKYFNVVIDRMEKLTNQSIREHIAVKYSFAYDDFVSEYNSFKGNAYGLANTLMQTAFLKPSMKSRKINNLYFAGQLTVPGPGVPPSIISGQVVAELIDKEYKYL